MSDIWQSNWDVFVDAAASMSRDAASTEEMASTFAGKTVRWSGRLIRKALDDEVPSVRIGFPVKEIKVCDGRFAVIDRVYLPVALDSVSSWRALSEGDTVVFEARLGEEHSPFPAIEAKAVGQGKEGVLMVRVEEGRVVRPEG